MRPNNLIKGTLVEASRGMSAGLAIMDLRSVIYWTKLDEASTTCVLQLLPKNPEQKELRFSLRPADS